VITYSNLPVGVRKAQKASVQALRARLKARGYTGIRFCRGSETSDFRGYKVYGYYPDGERFFMWLSDTELSLLV